MNTVLTQHTGLLRPARRSSILLGADDIPPGVFYDVSRRQYANPANNQKTDDCVGYATAGCMEDSIRSSVQPHQMVEILVKAFGRAIRRHGLVRWEIDGNKAWQQANDEFYNGKTTGGLQLDDAVKAAGIRGQLPPVEQSLTRIRPDPATQARALTRGPILCGHAIHDGWFRPNTENGQIPFIDERGFKYVPSLDAGHATKRIEAREQGGWHYYGNEGSWGREDYGYHGLFMLREDQDQQALIDDLMLLDVPGDWWLDTTAWWVLLKEATMEAATP